MTKSFFICSQLLIAISISFPCIGQVFLQGKIIDGETKEPLPFATVFIDKTNIGTVTDTDGKFSLPITTENVDIVMSYVGYENLIYRLDNVKLSANYIFELKPSMTQLEHIQVESKRDESWYTNFQVFKDQFLGTTPNGKNCTILNPNVLIIDFSPKDMILNVWAKEPLQIENAGLGYSIQYVLEKFTYDLRNKRMLYYGYTYFKNLEGSKSKERAWEKQRMKAYNGSTSHFIRALCNRSLEEEGFNLRRLYREPNPNYPTPEEQKAVLSSMSESGVTITASGGNAMNQPKIIERLDTAKVPYEVLLITQSLENQKLKFEGFFQVVFVGEKEDTAFISENFPFSPRKPTYQTSVFSLTVPEATIENYQINPTDILFEGYWAWEKMGDMLPINYQHHIEQ